jgi:hypothetical protein
MIRASRIATPTGRPPEPEATRSRELAFGTAESGVRLAIGAGGVWDTATARAAPMPILTGLVSEAGGSEPLPAVAGPLWPLGAGVLACSSDDGGLDGSGSLYVGSGALWPLDPLLECSPPVEPAGV